MNSINRLLGPSNECKFTFPGQLQPRQWICKLATWQIWCSVGPSRQNANISENFVDMKGRHFRENVGSRKPKIRSSVDRVLHIFLSWPFHLLGEDESRKSFIRSTRWTKILQNLLNTLTSQRQYAGLPSPITYFHAK